MSRWLVLLVMLVAATALPAAAHQQKAALTKVLFNHRTGQLDVMHRFYLHDAEHAVKKLFDRNADMLNSADTQQAFADYVAARFSLLHEQQLPLELVGSEVEGKFFWVYQQIAIPKSVTELAVKHDALRDIWPEQVNLVNIEGKEQIRSLNFEGSTEVLSVSFESHHH
ncbi:DUF6702 family protein [Lacimicrobium alkaliphilum]|uniref:Orphan protein n=1 Tax=Lacimicrobium alkaliphilum TaxID=1526571 RepID=A0ABQ1RI42_9ALTE|nr:DUF6702 family protein [Lacimicrobium alkaliphilum]GGD71116.1 hypothetical protein GCM10011357_27770 [Lacimicrobium alkaliphilum]